MSFFCLIGWLPLKIGDDGAFTIPRQSEWDLGWLGK
jgi:hypothetical protein